jgi:hypothetical protein
VTELKSNRRAIEEHDVVRLVAPIARWAAGTKGTVVSVRDGVMLVELPGEADSCLDLLEYVPAELLEVTWSQALQAAV